MLGQLGLKRSRKCGAAACPPSVGDRGAEAGFHCSVAVMQSELAGFDCRNNEEAPHMPHRAAWEAKLTFSISARTSRSMRPSRLGAAMPRSSARRCSSCMYCGGRGQGGELTNSVLCALGELVDGEGWAPPQAACCTAAAGALAGVLLLWEAVTLQVPCCRLPCCRLPCCSPGCNRIAPAGSCCTAAAGTRAGA